MCQESVRFICVVEFTGTVVHNIPLSFQYLSVGRDTLSFHSCCWSFVSLFLDQFGQGLINLIVQLKELVLASLIFVFLFSLFLFFIISFFPV